MTEQEYKAKILEIDRAKEQEKINIAKQYAIENNKLKIGDIAENFDGRRIRIDRINYHITFSSGSYPSCIYRGPRIKANGSDFINGERDFVYQCNLKKKERIKI